MKAKRGWIAAGLALTVLTTGAAPARRSKPTASAAARPRLALVLVVDGLSWSVVDQNRERLHGGLGRLLREGLVETGCTYRHFITETAPGHAALATGAPPRVTGIVANFWYEPAAGGGLQSIDAVSDPKAPAAGYGPGRLLVPTLADRLLAKSPGSRVVSISGKYRSAILLAGKDRRHSVYWLDPKTATFLTTPYYDAGSPAQAAARRIVAKLNEDSSLAALQKRFGAAWTRAGESEMAPAPQAELVRFQLPSLGRLFPHPLAAQKGGYAGGFYLSPYADELLADLTLALLGDETLALGKRDETDVLAVSFSTFDHLSHRYGPESAEALDALERIDRAIARILAALDAKAPGSSVVALSSDHGFLPIRDVRRPIVRTEPGEDPTIPHGRLLLDRFAGTLNQELVRSLCLDPASRPVGGVEKWLLFYDPKAFPARTVEGPCGAAGREIGPKDVDAALPAALKTAFRDSIDSVLLASDRARWSETDPATEFVRNTFQAGRSGDAFLVPHRGEMMHWDADTRGTDHGSTHEYDIHVPLIFWGAAFSHADAGEPTTPYDLAPTLASLLGIDLPDAVGKSRVQAKGR